MVRRPVLGCYRRWSRICALTPHWPGSVEGRDTRPPGKGWRGARASPLRVCRLPRVAARLERGCGRGLGHLFTSEGSEPPACPSVHRYIAGLSIMSIDRPSTTRAQFVFHIPCPSDDDITGRRVHVGAWGENGFVVDRGGGVGAGRGRAARVLDGHPQRALFPSRTAPQDLVAGDRGVVPLTPTSAVMSLMTAGLLLMQNAALCCKLRLRPHHALSKARSPPSGCIPRKRLCSWAHDRVLHFATCRHSLYTSPTVRTRPAGRGLPVSGTTRRFPWDRLRRHVTDGEALCATACRAQVETLHARAQAPGVESRQTEPFEGGRG